MSGAALAIWGEDVPLSGRWGWGHSPGFVRPPSPHRWQADLPTSASGLHETASAPESKDNRLSSLVLGPVYLYGDGISSIVVRWALKYLEK